MKKYKYSPKIKSKIVELLKADTYTISEICSIVGIATRTFYEWQNENEDFAKAVEQARLDRMQMFVKEAKKSLLKKIQGYTVDETKVVTVPGSERDENGRPKPRIKEQTTTKKHLAPDTAAIIFTLTNGEPETWRNRYFGEVTGKDGKDLIPPRVLTKKEAKELFDKLEDDF